MRRNDAVKVAQKLNLKPYDHICYDFFFFFKKLINPSKTFYTVVTYKQYNNKKLTPFERAVKFKTGIKLHKCAHPLRDSNTGVFTINQPDTNSLTAT